MNATSEAPPDKKLISARDMGRFIGKHRETILSWARDGLIPCHKFSARTILFNELEVKAAAKERGLVK